MPDLSFEAKAYLHARALAELKEDHPEVFDAELEWQEPWAIIDDYDGNTTRAMLCIWLPVSGEQEWRDVPFKIWDEYTWPRDSEVRPASTMPYWARATKHEKTPKDAVVGQE